MSNVSGGAISLFHDLRTRAGSLLCLVFFGLAGLSSGCTSKPESPVIGHPVLPTLARDHQAVEEILLSARLPGSPAWRVRLTRGKSGGWKLSERSDFPGTTDIADAALADHLLELLSTFTTEEEAASSSESVTGLNPYQVEIRLRSRTESKPKEVTLQFGEPTSSGTTIYFRREGESKAWVGRGGLILLFASFQSPEFFAWKMPYLGASTAVSQIELEKTAAPDAGSWVFKRDFHTSIWANPEGAPTHVSRPSEILERLLHQRIVKTLPAPPTDLPKVPDWRIRISANGLPTQTLEIFFAVDGIYARNLARSSEVMELYPEFAGTLRDFTHFRFTPLKSRTK